MVGCGCAQFLELLPHHGDAHGDVKPVEQMLSERAQIQLQFAHGLAAVREKRDRLTHLQSLRLEQLGQPTLGFSVVAGHKVKALGITVGWHALAGNQFEPASLAIVTVPSIVAVLQAAQQRALTWMQTHVPTTTRALALDEIYANDRRGA